MCQLPELRTLLLGHNNLCTDCPTHLSTTLTHTSSDIDAPVALAPYSRHLCHLELQDNPTMPLPVELARSCSALSYLDLTLSCLPYDNWDALHAALPEGCHCMHPHRQLVEGRWEKVAGSSPCDEAPGDGARQGGTGQLECEILASVMGLSDVRGLSR